jgi:hypothetical protein
MKKGCSKLSHLISSLETHRLTHDKRQSWIFFFLGQKRLERDKHELLMRQIVVYIFLETIAAYSEIETNRFNGAY